VRRPADAWPVGHASSSRGHHKEPHEKCTAFFVVISTRRPPARSRGGQRCGQCDPWRNWPTAALAGLPGQAGPGHCTPD